MIFFYAGLVYVNCYSIFQIVRAALVLLTQLVFLFLGDIEINL